MDELSQWEKYILWLKKEGAILSEEFRDKLIVQTNFLMSDAYQRGIKFAEERKGEE